MLIILLLILHQNKQLTFHNVFVSSRAKSCSCTENGGVAIILSDSANRSTKKAA